ncbi:MAG: sensor histidine kinase [Actinomycetota bacterium]
MARSEHRTGPSRWWTVVAVATAAVSIGAAVAAALYQRSATRPIGEGQLFLQEAREGRSLLDGWIARGASPGEAVRRLRNQMGIEAVALVDHGGAVTASTSRSLVGTPLHHPVLRTALEEGKFGAVAAPLQHAVQIDGVTEWWPGDALYSVVLPGGEAGSLLLHYDVAELLERRMSEEGIQPGTVQLATVALLSAIGSITVLVGRWRTAQRYRRMELEAEFLRKESETLSRYNAELEEARGQAERALKLAEEKNRIRSEFVLMINHELRTPLTSLVTGAELLHGGPDLDRERRTILESMIEDGHRLQTMIDQLLAVARVENRSLAFSPRSVPLSEVRDVVARVDSRVAIRGSEPGSHPGGEPSVVTDTQTLSHLVRVLVDNAFTHGAGTVTVDCSPVCDGRPQLQVGPAPEPAASVSVIDDGPGIRADFLPRAFEKFEKDSRSSGTGLGLYLARLMAEAIGAGLGVWTSPAGTTVAVALPVAEVETQAGVA